MFTKYRGFAIAELWLAYLLVVCSQPPYGHTQSVRSAQLAALFDDAWQYELQSDPLFATRVGDRRYNALLPHVGLQAQRDRLEQKRKFRQQVGSIQKDTLARSDLIHLKVFLRQLDSEIAEGEFQSYLIPITNRSGFYIDFPDLPQWIPLESVQDYENYIARLRAFPRYTEEHLELLRSGIENRIVLPAIVLEGAEQVIQSQIVEDPRQSVLFRPFLQFSPAVPEDKRAALAEAGEAAIRDEVIPAYRRILAFMNREYIPAARSTVGAYALPRGREFYQHRVRMFTTLDLTPEKIHEIGLQEVRRIREEMEAIPPKIGFSGSFNEFLNYLRTNPKFYADSPDQLLKEVSFVLKRMDGQLPRLFRTLPRTPYGIREVPSHIAPRTTTAYYMPPAGDGSRAGFYYINTYDLKSRPLYEIEALSLHEAVPGHHLQIALAQELHDMPAFRRYAEMTAFVEGWALYAERLGLEVGFYRDPVSDFGRLSYEMWRACRLVVDTGIHYFGWSRPQAIDFMAAHTALSQRNIEAEVDRYISWPGQAVAYKIGELKIRQLRSQAEQQLGERFDLREFHDVVLSNGPVPLDVLEEQVQIYIDKHRSP